MRTSQWLVVLVVAIAASGVVGWFAGNHHGRNSVSDELVADMLTKLDAGMKDNPAAERTIAIMNATAVNAQSEFQLHQIGRAMGVYQQAHGGAAPKSLSDLIGLALVTRQTFRSPTGGTYVLTGKPMRTGTVPVAYEDGNPKGGNVLYADGHVDWQRTEDWEGRDWPKPAVEFYPGGAAVAAAATH